MPSLAIIISLYSCRSGRHDSVETLEESTPINTEKVSFSNSKSQISLSGNVEGNKTVRLGFMVAGKINYISAQEGQNISKGQLISSLDPTSYSIAKAQADIQVNQVSDEYNRLKIMYDRKSISESDFNKVKFTMQQAKQQQKLHGKNLADTRLYSPISGVLLKKMAETGEIIGVGTPLFVVADISKIKVNAYIPENELNNVKLGEQASVFISSLNKTFTGRITEIGSAADATSRAFTLKIELANPDLLIRPGMIAEVLLQSKDTKNILTIPAESILHDTDDQSYVFVVDSTKNKAYKRRVTVGQLINNKIEVKSGVADGDIIVSGGQQKLTDGASISLNK